MSTGHAQHHFDELDSLRGLAAMSVVFYHVTIFWNPPHPLWWVRLLQSPLGLLLSGPDAVYLFFVMSGFVLFLPYLRAGGAGPYGHYLIKRICRIYLPYLAALVLAIAADLLTFQQVGRFFPAVPYWRRPFSVSAVWAHVIFIGRGPIDTFNPAFWSLVHEMRLSLVFPLIAFWPPRLPLSAAALLSLATCVAGFVLAAATNTAEWATLGYSSLFLAGAVVAQHLPALRRMTAPRPVLLPVALLTLAVFLAKVLHFFPHRLQQQWWWIVPLHGSAAALVMVVALTTPGLHGPLRHRSLRWLGRMSYAIYLLHGIVLFTLASLFWTHTRHHAMLLLAGVVLTLALAALFHTHVEQPSIALGRWLCQRLAATPRRQLSRP